MANRVTSMTESGLLAAITVVMALIGVYVPLLGTVAILLWPLPILVLIVRHGLKWGLMAVFVSAVLTAALVEPAVSLRLALAFAPGGVALGLGFRNEWSSVRTLVTGIAVSMISKLAALALLFAITGIEPFSMQFDMMEASFDQTVEFYRGVGMPEAQLAEVRENLVQNLSLMRLLVPLLVVLMGLMDTVVNYLVGGKVLRRLGHDVKTLPPFVEWKLPSVFVYMFGFSLIGAYWGTTREIDLLYRASLNLSMLATFAGLVEGVVVYMYAWRHFRWPKFFGAFGLTFIFLNAFLLRLLCLVGLFDMVLDYRRRYWGNAK